MKLKIARGTTSKIVRLFIQDSTSATGAGLSGLTNAASGLAAYYIAEGAASATAIALLAGTVGTWSSGGFTEVDAVHMPGVYELGLPNAVLASGASVLVYLSGAASMVPTLLEIELDGLNYQDGLRAGLGALPGAAAGSAGGLPTATNASGQPTIAGYASGQDPASLVLAAPANKLLTNASGQVDVDWSQAVPATASGLTLGRAALAAIAEGVGVWKYDPVGRTLQEFAEDGTTLLRSFALTIDASGTITQRS